MEGDIFILHDIRLLDAVSLVAGVVDLGDVEGLLGVLALEVVLPLAERAGLLALHLLGAFPRTLRKRVKAQL